ncbi:hypothetical protein ACFO5K_04310 [Nocardia halotolerans]|uniref:Uncharacterized protein n=1 Tax=Nocardia halotolerans TaxID=1755878 RepID=A0ABV8VCF5_9NOCA
MNTKTATLLTDEVAHTVTGETFCTDANVYRLSPPLLFPNGIADYVVASTLDDTILTPTGFRRSEETHLYVSDEEGMVVNWNTLPGSGRDRDHAQALAAAGYTIVAAPVEVNACKA